MKSEKYYIIARRNVCFYAANINCVENVGWGFTFDNVLAYISRISPPIRYNEPISLYLVCDGLQPILLTLGRMVGIYIIEAMFYRDSSRKDKMRLEQLDLEKLPKLQEEIN